MAAAELQHLKDLASRHRLTTPSVAGALLGLLIPAGGLPLVLELAQAPEPLIRKRAGAVVFGIDGFDEELLAATTQAREALLADPHPEVAYSAAMADEEILSRYTRLAPALAAAKSPEALQRAEAIRTLAHDCDITPRLAEVVAVIASALNDPDPREFGVRWIAVKALKHLGARARSAEAALRRALQDPNPRVRIEAAEVLCQWQDPEPAVAVLEAALDEPALSMRRYACEGLGEALHALGASEAGQRCVAALARALSDGEEPVVDAALCQLGRASSSAARSALQMAQTCDPRAWVQAAAGRVLEQMEQGPAAKGLLP